MPVRRDPRTRRWFFRTHVTLPDGTNRRVFGTPGAPGPYQELEQSKSGAREAERRAIDAVLKEAASALLPCTQEVKPTEQPEKTISQHAETFVDLYKPGSKDSEKREKRRVLKTHLLPVFGHRTIESLQQRDLDKFASDELGRGMKVKTVNNRLAVLSTLIKYVTGTKSKLRFNLDGMTAELHAVAWADVDRLIEACENERDEAVILLAAEAGLRAGEIRGLQRADIAADVITIRRALDKQTNDAVPPKHNKRRTVPASRRLIEVLDRLSRNGLWVISDPDGDFVMYDELLDRVKAIYGRAGVASPPKPVHCLRHTFGTMMARRVPLPVLQQLMGHADVKTTLRYVDIAEQDKRDAIAAVFGSGSGLAANWQQAANSKAAHP